MIIHDHLKILTPAQTQQLNGHNWPFQVYLLVSGPLPLETLRSQVSQQISDPNMIGIGIDPQGHHVVVRFGTGSGVPKSAWDAIAKAGNARFHEQDWVGGIEQIAKAATEARTAASEAHAASTVAVVPNEGESSSSFPFVTVGILGVVGIILLIVAVSRSRRAERKRQEESRRNIFSTPEPERRYGGYEPTRAVRSNRVVVPINRTPPSTQNVAPMVAGAAVAATAVTAAALVESSREREQERERERKRQEEEAARRRRESESSSSYTDTSSYVDTSSYDSSSSSSSDSGGSFDGGGSDSSF